MWYYARSGEQVGPIESDVFARLAGEGAIGPDTLVWREGMTDWAPYRTLQSGNADGQAAGSVRCVQCGHLVSPEHAVEFEGQMVCGVCKPLYFQRLREGGAAPAGFVYASILKRFGALVLDSFIVNIIVIVLVVGLSVLAAVGNGGQEPSEALAMLLGFAVIFGVFGTYAFYMTWFVGRFGATPGKMALGIKIVRGDGARVSYARAFGRLFAHQLSGMVLYIGFIVAFFDDEKRALHDMICDTRVIET